MRKNQTGIEEYFQRILLLKMCSIASTTQLLFTYTLILFINILSPTIARAGTPTFTAPVTVPETFSLDGTLYSNPEGTEPLLDHTVEFVLQITGTDQDCVLYEEKQVVDTFNSNGYFNLHVGSPTSGAASAKRTSKDFGNTMNKVFSNQPGLLIYGKNKESSASCYFNPNRGNKRFVRMLFTASDGVLHSFDNALTVDSVPYAIAADTSMSLQGLTPENFIQTNPKTSLSQVNMEAIFANTPFQRLQNLLATDPQNYMRTGNNGTASLPKVTTDPLPANLQVGQIWYDSTNNLMKYYDGAIQTIGGASAGIAALSSTANINLNGTSGTFINHGTVNVDLADTGITAGTYTKLVIDAKGRAIAGGTFADTDFPNFTTAGKVSGNAITSGTIGGSTAINTTGYLQALAGIYSPYIYGGNTNGQNLTLDSTSGTATKGFILLAPNGGNVGIGTNSPVSNLHIVGASNTAVSISSSTYATFSASGGGVGVILQAAPTGYGFVGTSNNYPLNIIAGNSTKMTVTTAGKVGIGNGVPTARLHITAGSATAGYAPLKFTAGSLLTTPEDGAVEYDGTNFFITAGSNRQAIPVSSGSTSFTNVANISNVGGDITLTPNTANSVIIDSPLASTNSSTGALKVLGGAGIGGALNVGGAINSTGTIATSGAFVGSSLYGATTASGNLTLDSTTNATKGNILLAPNGGNVGVGNNNPTSKFHILGDLSAGVSNDYLSTTDPLHHIFQNSMSNGTLLNSATGIANSVSYINTKIVPAYSYPISNQVTVDQNTTANLITGIYMRPQTYTSYTGAVDTLNGFSSDPYVQMSTGGTVTNLNGFDALTGYYAPGTSTVVTNWRQMHIRNPAGGLNKYGLLIDNISGGSLSNYALYSIGGYNYFGGPVGIGTTVGDASFNVSGNSHLGALSQGATASERYYPNVISYGSAITQTGAWIVHTPIDRTSNLMFKIRVHGYEYGSSKIIDFNVVGYSYDANNGSVDGQPGTVIKTNLIDHGNDGLPKYIGVDAAGKVAVALGNETYSVYYGRIAVDAWITRSTSEQSTGWSIDFNTTAGFGWLDFHGPLLSQQYFAGNVGVGTINPSAKLHLGAGGSAAGNAPLKFTAGPLLSTAEDGAMEYDGTNFFVTAGSTRHAIPISSGSSSLTSVANISNSGGDITLSPNAIAFQKKKPG